MTVWHATDITTTPETVLSNWKIYEVCSELWPTKTLHFVGYNVTEREGRVSSAIQEFDLHTMCGRTGSGRIYKLQGPRGSDSDSSYVFARWCNLNKITELSEFKIDQIA
jgi:hypothetical protein